MSLSASVKNSLSDIEKVQFFRALCRKDLSTFIRKSFEIVSPGDVYLHNWHIELIAKYLQACKDGDIKRLVINIPPRHLKSISVAVAFPAWLIGHDPTTRILCASYSQSLSLKHSLDCRAVMENPFYKFLFPETKLVNDQNTKAKFMTTERGFRFATSVGGTITGEGGDFLIIDDPQNATQAHSEAFRETTKLWFDQAFTTRLNDKKKGCIIVIMQRLHEDDLTGHLLSKGGWEHLRIPLVADHDQEFKVKDFHYKRKIGELLHPDSMGPTEVEQTKVEMGSYAFAGQYQQTPMAAGGNIIRLEWIRTYRELPPESKIYSWSWDTAIKVGQENDFSVGLLWAECNNGYYLIDFYKNKLEYPELRKMVNALYNKHKSSEVLIEDKASGQQILQDFKRMGNIPVIAMMPGKDMPNSKEERMRLISPQFEAGKVFFPHDVPWLSDVVQELVSFPSGRHDDVCDAVTQYLARRLSSKSKAPSIRIL